MYIIINIYIYFKATAIRWGCAAAHPKVHLLKRGEIKESHKSTLYAAVLWHGDGTSSCWKLIFLLEGCKVPAVPKVSTRVVEPVSWSSLLVPGQQKRIDEIEGYCVLKETTTAINSQSHTLLIHTYGEPQGKMKASGSSNDSNKLSPNASH